MNSAAQLAGVVFATMALACCTPAPEAPQTADQAARAACRQQAEQSFNIRNRADLYKSDYGRDAPLSGQLTPQIDRGLADRYSYEQSYLDCLRSRGARQTPTTLPAAPAAATTPPGLPQPPPSSRTSAPLLPAAAPSAPASSAPPSSSSDLSRPPPMTP